MAIEVKLPDFGPLVEDATIVRWIKQEGDTVKKGDALLEVDIDKSNIEIEALWPGILREIKAKEGEIITPGTVLAVIEETE